MKEKSWLSHLKSSIPEEARGYSVSMYSIALEGWRRGLTLKFINENRRKSELRYSLASKEKEHRFIVSRGDYTTGETLRICRNKHTTKKYLVKADVPTPQGEFFKKEASDEEIIDYANTLGYPLVLKPADGTGGAGVIANIKNQTEFKEALDYVKYQLGFSDVIVEKFFEGIDHRVYVVGDKAVAAYIRIPANVIGNGKSTIRELIKKNNAERNKNPALFRRSIKIDKELRNMIAEKNYNLDSIPKEGERVFLKSKANISSGGDSVDVTDELTDEIKNIAVRAVAAIPGLKNSGVDIIVDKENNTGTILEINTQASINSHLFPMEGEARDIPKAIIDLYFPETKDSYDKNGPLYYFDFEHMYESFQNGYADEYTIPPMPTGDVSSTRFIVEGKVKNVLYENWVRRQAIGLNLHGYIKKLLNGNASVIISGKTEKVEKFKEIIKNGGSKRSVISNVKERKRTSPVKIGFEILESNSRIKKGNTNTNSSSKNAPSDGYYPVKITDVRARVKRKKV